MKHFNILSYKNKITFHLLVLVLLVNIPSAFTQTSFKKVSPWYIYKEGKGFDEIKPFSDIISSISVFGNPPKEFIAECHKNGIQVYHGVSEKEDALNTADKMEATADKYVNICEMDDYDGIDLDYEQLSPDFKNTYSVFLKKVSDKLHNSGKKLSQCVGFYATLLQDSTPRIFYDPKVIAETCDLVRVMCYDMHYAPNRSEGIGPTSSYSWTRDAMIYWMKYVPKDKLIMGLPAYSNDYTMTVNGTGRQVYAPAPDNYGGILLSPIWQWYERMNIYVYNDLKGDTHLFYASDQKSTKNLLEISNEFAIHTIGFWHFTSVAPQTWSVVREWINKHD
jgi:spore germination protein YaaH